MFLFHCKHQDQAQSLYSGGISMVLVVFFANRRLKKWKHFFKCWHVEKDTKAMNTKEATDTEEFLKMLNSLFFQESNSCK